jgi:hypothetical protein
MWSTCRAAMVLGEREMLDGWLEYHRAMLLVKCANLTDDHCQVWSTASTKAGRLRRRRAN